MVQNGYGLYNDVNGEQIPGLERFPHLVDLEEPLPLTFMETYSITECTAELSTSCYAGMLMLQAMGLGGWMFDGIDRSKVTALPTTPTCGPQSRPSSSESSVPEDRFTRTRRVPGRRAPGCGAAHRSTAKSSRSAWRSWRSTSTTASGSSPVRSRASSS